MNYSSSDPLSDSKAVHRRIAEALAAPMHANLRYGKASQIQAYTRRHLSEHAAAGESMNEGIISSSILPYLDVATLKQTASSDELPLMPLVSKVAHAWSWAHPGRNAAALRFISAAELNDVRDLRTPWLVPWAKSTGPSEILARFDSFVSLDAALLDGRITVVTATQQGLVELWDLASGQSSPLSFRSASVSVVAIGSAPGGGAIVSVGTEGGRVLCWRVQGFDPRRAGWPDPEQQGSFDVGDAVTALSVTTIRDRPHALVGQVDGCVTILDCAEEGQWPSQLVHEGQVTGITSIKLENGALAAVSVGVDETVRLSHLRFWPRPMTVLRSDEAINAVAVLRLAGKPAAVTVGDAGSVRIWDLPPEPPRYRKVAGHDQDVITVAAWAGPGGEPLVVTGDSRGCLRMVDPDEAKVVGDPIEGHGNRVTGLALERTKDGRSVAVSGGDDGIVRSWDLADQYRNAPQSAAQRSLSHPRSPAIRLWRLDVGNELGGDVGAHYHRMAVVATGRLADGTVIAVTDAGSAPRATGNRGATVGIGTAALPDGGIAAISAGDDGRLRFWDLTPCPGLPPRLSREESHPGVLAVTTAEARGRPVAVSAGRDYALRIWDMQDDRRPVPDLPRLNRWVTALATAAAPGRAYVVSGSEDASLRVWDLDSGQQVGSTVHVSDRRISALAATWAGDRLIAVTASPEDRVARWCDLRGITPTSGELIGHDRSVTAVAILPDPGRPLVVTASEDHTIRVWDLLASAPLQVQNQDLDPIPVPGTVRAIACFNAAGPSALIAGDDVFAVVRWAIRDALDPVLDRRDYVASLQLTPDLGDGEVASGSIDGTLSAKTLPVTAVAGEARSPHRGHAFISYAREDSAEVDELQRALEAAGVPVWRDTDSLRPGDNWKRVIQEAISHDALVFIACFSSRGTARSASYQNEELLQAVEQVRLRRPDDPWLMPVRFDDCSIPDFDLGPGRVLSSIHRADLFGPGRGRATQRLVEAVQRLLRR